MKRTLSVLTAALFAGALAVPAMAQSSEEAVANPGASVNASAAGAETKATAENPAKVAQSSEKTGETGAETGKAQPPQASGAESTAPKTEHKTKLAHYSKRKSHRLHKGTKTKPEAGSTSATGTGSAPAPPAGESGSSAPEQPK